MLLDRETHQQQDPCCPMAGLRLLLSKRPELLPSRHYRDRRELEMMVFDSFCCQKLLLPFLDLVEEVYGQLFTFHYLNTHLRDHWTRIFLTSGGRAFWSSVFCHPLADLSMISVQAYSDVPWKREDPPDTVITLGDLLEVGVIYDRGILVYTPYSTILSI